MAAALLVVGSLSAGLVQTRKAERRERARFDQVRQLATRFLFDFDRDIRQLPGATAARERLVSTALQTLNSLAAGSGNDPALTAELAQAYVSVGEVQGLPGMLSLGHTADAERSFRKACSLILPLVEQDPSPANPYRRPAALSYSRLGYLLWRTSRTDDARRWMLEARALIEPMIHSGKAGPADFRVAANIHTYLSSLELQAFHGKLAAGYAVRAVELMRKYQLATPGMRARSDLARVMSVGGGAAASTGDLAGAAAMLRESRAMRQALYREFPTDTENRRELAISGIFLAGVLYHSGGLGLGQAAEARKQLEEGVRLMREMAAEDPKNDSARHDLGLILKELADNISDQDPRAAEAYLREGLRVLEARPAGSPARERHIGLLHAVLGGVLKSAGRGAEARQELAVAERGFAHENPADALARGDFVQLWYEQGDFDRVWQSIGNTVQAAPEDLYAAYRLADCAPAPWPRPIPRRRPAGRLRRGRPWAPWKGRYPEADRILGAMSRR